MSKIKTKNLIVIAFVSLWLSGCMAAKSHVGRVENKDAAALGLTLVAQYKPLHLKIYADVSSTNRVADYLVCEGDDDVIFRRNESSNAIEQTYFENGYQVLTTKFSDKKTVSRRMLFINNDAGRPIYTYVDKHGSGKWDFFMDENDRSNYTRSNLCWVPIREVNSTRQP